MKTKEQVIEILRQLIGYYQSFTKWVLRHTPEIQESQRGKDWLADIDRLEAIVKSELCGEEQKESHRTAEEILREELSEYFWEIITRQDDEGHTIFKDWIIEAMEEYGGICQTNSCKKCALFAHKDSIQSVNLREELIKLWQIIDDKRKFVVSNMHKEDMKDTHFSVVYNQMLSGIANTLTDIQDDINTILSTHEPTQVTDRPKIVCICGSGRFLKEMHEVEERLTLEGKIVLMIGVNTKDVARTKDMTKYKPMLDELHLRKIDLADEVFVVNVGGYIGESTRKEVVYTELKGKHLEYLERETPGKVPYKDTDSCSFGELS
jgi:hypothetical protein